jgi:hypothetical protein
MDEVILKEMAKQVHDTEIALMAANLNKRDPINKNDDGNAELKTLALLVKIRFHDKIHALVNYINTGKVGLNGVYDYYCTKNHSK